MLIDETIIKVKAGQGGKGAVAFNKNKLSLGPVGGNGGQGGNVYLVGVSDLGALRQFRFKKKLKQAMAKMAEVSLLMAKAEKILLFKFR